MRTTPFFLEPLIDSSRSPLLAEKGSRLDKEPRDDVLKMRILLASAGVKSIGVDPQTRNAKVFQAFDNLVQRPTLLD